MKAFVIFIILFLFSAGISMGQDTDSTIVDEKIHLRSFDQETLAEFRNDDDFKYNQLPDERKSYIKMLINKLFGYFFRLFGNVIVAWLVMGILLLIGIVGLGFALYGLFGIGKTIPIYSQDQSKLPYAVHEENIDAIDFLSEIEKAVSQNDFRKAIRLLYLHSLKLLSDQKLIEWQPSKTNYEYVLELRQEDNRRNFQSIIYYFEYVWYGDFHPERMHFESMKEVFTELKKSLAP